MIAFPDVPAAVALPVFDPPGISHELGPDGPISSAMPVYEDRPSQREMAAVIAGLYTDGGVGLLEAGTGVGKSLAYLLPALRWAAATGERTIVSTNTINLQEQLVRKDLPFLARALSDQPVRFALLKGWHNYLCLLRMEQADMLGPGLLEDAGSRELAQIRAWSEISTDGSLSDLPASPSTEVWDEVAAEPDLCLRASCPHYERCFLFGARRLAAAADVIVVNHHLLMSDVAVRRMQQNWEEAAVIPAYSRLVIDEGHHLEDAASAHLGASATRRAVQRVLGRLERRGRGLLPSLSHRLSADPDLLNSASLEILNRRLFPAVTAAREKSGVVFDLLEVVMSENRTNVFRLTQEFAFHAVWKGGLEAAMTDLVTEIAILMDGLETIRARLETRRRDDAVLPLLGELRGASRRLEALASALEGTLRPDPSAADAVRWIESRGREGNVSVSWVPLNLAPILRDDLFERVETAIITSATLAAEGRFDFLAGRLGLDSSSLPLVTESFASPFDFPRQALLAIPSDFPLPNVDSETHMKAVVAATLDMTAASDGGIFVLFTSHRDVRAAASELRVRGLDHSRPLLVHGEENRDVLLARFRESGRAVLVGTSSYWEGVDVPGRALRGLLIARLPFRVPTEPVTAAQCEAIAERGGDPFSEYMLPHASLRLKQGFGRLIRTATDRGAIVIADSRIVSKGYGRDLLKALPPAQRVIAPWSQIVGQLNSFYAVTN